MYDPQTLAFSFPPYPSGGMSLRGHPKPWSLARALYALKAWIGVDVWHVDPERGGTGNRTDDSCGWFERGPKEYADAVRYILADKDAMHEIDRSIATRAPVTGPYGQTYPRMPMGETLALTLMVARYLELRRWWNGAGGNGGAHGSRRLRYFTRKRAVDGIAYDLALNPIDNLSSVDEPETVLNLVAAALHRHFRPWWRHPRWHVHHWKVNFDLARNLKRMFEKCAGCGKRLGFGYCPTTFSWDGNGPVYHSECAGSGAAQGAKCSQ